MDLGIKVFRNCELFKGVTIMSILKNGKIVTFYESIKIHFDIKMKDTHKEGTSFKNATFQYSIIPFFHV